MDSPHISSTAAMILKLESDATRANLVLARTTTSTPRFCRDGADDGSGGSGFELGLRGAGADMKYPALRMRNRSCSSGPKATNTRRSFGALQHCPATSSTQARCRACRRSAFQLQQSTLRPYAAPVSRPLIQVDCRLPSCTMVL